MAEPYQHGSERRVPHSVAVERHYSDLNGRMARAVARICPPSLRDDADDLVQNALIRIYRRDESEQTRRLLTNSYLNKVAYCTMVDELRRRKLPIAAEAEDIEQHSDAAPATDPARACGATELGSSIQRCLAEQNANRRRAATLRLLGHSVTEVSKLLDEKPKAAENLVYRGLAQLRKCLRRKGLSP